MRLRVLLIVVGLLALGAGAAWWTLRPRPAEHPPPLARDTPVAGPHAEAASTATPPPAAAEPAPARLPVLRGELALTGRVIDIAGKPVPGATVKLASESVLSLTPLVKKLCDCNCGELLVQCRCARAKKLLPELVRKAGAEPPAQATASTRTDGSFGFAGIPRDRYRVWARAPGMAVSAASNVAIGGASDSPVEITLAPAVEVRGSVRTSGNSPLAGVTVVALSELEVGGIGRAVSGGDGRFVVPSLGSATYFLYASARGFASAAESNVDPGQDVVLSLERGGVIAGHVHDEGGAAVADAVVQVVGAEGESPHTDRDGAFRIEDLDAGKYKVWAEKGTQTSERIEQVALARGETKDDLVLRLDEGATISGRALVTSTNAPVVGAKVGLHQEHRGAVREAWSDGDGHYQITGVPPGAYSIEVEAADAHLADEVAVTVTARENHALDLALAPSAALEGVVADSDGQPIAGAEIRPYDRSGKTAKSDSKGRYRIEGLTGKHEYTWDPSGTKGDGLTVLVSHPDYIAKRAEVPAGGTEHGAHLDVILDKGGTIRGSVTVPEEGPLGGLAIELSRHRDPTERKSRSGHTDGDAKLPTAKTKRDGTFELRGVPEGRFDVAASGQGMIRAEHGPVEIAREQVVDGITIRLTRGEVIEGQVVNPKGEPVAGATIYARPERNEASERFDWYRNRTESTADGHFHLAALERGTYELKASQDAYQAAERPGVASGTTDVRIELTPAPRIVGRVVDAATGQPIQSFRIDYRPMTSATGEFEVAATGGEKHRPTVSASGYASQRLGPFSTSATGQLDAGTVRLTKGATVKGRVLEANGTPRAGMTVMAFRAHGEDDEDLPTSGDAPGSTDAEGTFTVTGLGPGTWTLMATSPGPDRDDSLASMTSTQVQVRGGETREGVVLRIGDWSGMREMVKSTLRETLVRPLSAADAKRLGPAVDTVVDALGELIGNVRDLGDADPSMWAEALRTAIPAENRTAEVEEVLAKVNEHAQASAGADR
ncbi:MAG: carboxypeptidase regulatory-like domain-containing protein [Deltaproteobacteria bacterium]|nr:carboxypeptidase regulatory-like domain-containing protein [Deltaproteobacteria bacterium]